MMEVPDTCPDCGHDELETWSTEAEVGPTNTSGTLAGNPVPNYKMVPATAVECPNCDFFRKVLRDRGGR